MAQNNVDIHMKNHHSRRRSGRMNAALYTARAEIIHSIYRYGLEARLLTQYERTLTGFPDGLAGPSW